MRSPAPLRAVAPVARVLLAVALLGAAMLLWKNMPTKLDTWAPIAVDARVGERAVGRDLAVTVHSVDLGRALTFQQSGAPTRLPATGAWLVFTLTYEPLHDHDGRPVVRLVADGRTYQSTVGSLRGPPVPIGVPKNGVVAFELPDVPAAAEFKVANQTQEKWGNPLNAPLDSQISLPIDVAALPVRDAVNLDELGAR